MKDKVENTLQVLEKDPEFEYEKVDLIDDSGYDKETAGWDLKDLYHPNSCYTPETKVRAVMAYLVTGTSKQAEQFSGVKATVIRDWKSRAEWWPLVMGECRKKKQDELDAAYTSILHQAVGTLSDRIENGDEFIDRNGKRYRKLLSARDLAIITGVIYDKRALLRGDPTGRIERRTSGDNLKMLQANFEKIAKQLEAKTIEGEHTTIIED